MIDCNTENVPLMLLRGRIYYLLKIEKNILHSIISETLISKMAYCQMFVGTAINVMLEHYPYKTASISM